MSGPPPPDAFRYLFGLEQFGIKFGLAGIRAIVDALGHPERTFRSIHVAGTNGKGSVTAMVDAALRAAGHRTARYTSPHLVRLNERFVVDGRPAADADIADAVDAVRSAIDRLLGSGGLLAQPTFFEVTTAAAFELFRRAGAEVAVVEVGLGGRLDATNVLEPVATAITSIGFDHQQYLGQTLGEIAAEKGGIIKPGVPVVAGELSPEAMAVVERIALERRAELIRATGNVPASFGIEHLALRGAHQRSNAAVAVRLLEAARARGIAAPAEAVAAGLANVRWPGRLDSRVLGDGREILLDAAHNPEGAAALGAFLDAGIAAGAARRPLVFAAMRDKDVRAMLTPLARVISALVVTRASNPRSAEPAEIAAMASTLFPRPAIVVEPSRERALSAAWARSRSIVVAGSIFLLGDVLSELGLEVIV